MRTKRWPVFVVALFAGGTLLTPEIAGANVARDRVAATYAGGGANVIVVQRPRAVPASAMAGALGRVRHQAPTSPDGADPWSTSIAATPIATRSIRLKLDRLDPWSGEVVTIEAPSYAEVDSSDPYGSD